MPTGDQTNATAQDLTTTALKQWDKLQNGFLSEEVYNPTESFPRRPWIDEPSGSLPFDEQGGQALGIIGTVTIVLDFYVPNGMDGVIKWISCNTVFPFNNFSGDLVWQILQNGRAIRNFDNIRAEKGTIQIPRPISPIRIYSGDHIQFVVNHVANVALNGQIVCSLNGYFYPNQGLS
jgi:hypothetical protein